MINKITSCLLLFLFTCASVKSQSLESIRPRIAQILENKSATVGVAIQGSKAQDTLSINGDKHLPMQSVFKFHLALAVMHQVDQGKLRLNQLISIDQDLINSYQHLWSPLRKRISEWGEDQLSGHT